MRFSISASNCVRNARLYTTSINTSRYPNNYWDDYENQRKFVESMSSKFNIKDMSDWYKISVLVTDLFLKSDFQDWHNTDASLIRSKYNNSPALLLAKVYPDYEWLPWKFSWCPRNHWEDIDNQRKYMNWLAKELHIKEMSDWYKIRQNVQYKHHNFIYNKANNSKKGNAYITHVRGINNSIIICSVS